jgi:hypothetical protein
MSKASLSSLMVLCAALAACSDNGTNPLATAPDVRPSHNEVLADLRGAATVDGPMDVTFARDAASTQMAASVNAATGGRASAHVALTLGTGFFTNIQTEQYNFVALSTASAPTPFAAKGEYHMTLTTASGVVQEFHGDVICLGITGNKARIAGQLTSVVVNGIPRAINPNQSHNIWTATDNGEGNGTADQASPMIFFPAALAPLHCASDFIPPQFANEQGNVQVQP